MEKSLATYFRIQLKNVHAGKTDSGSRYEIGTARIQSTNNSLKKQLLYFTNPTL